MVGLGTAVNTAAIIAGGLCGLLFGRFLPQRTQDTLCRCCGLCTLLIGVSGAMQGMLSVDGTALVGNDTIGIILCITAGALVGELLNIEDHVEDFGQWLKIKTGSAKDRQFVQGFVTASLTVCIGAMAVVGSIEDGINANHSILFTKSTLDFIIVMVMSSSMGKGCLFSAIPVAVFQGSVTLLAQLMQPLMTPAAQASLSQIGSILIFCVGVNLVWEKKIRVANLLPALLFAVAITFF